MPEQSVPVPEEQIWPEDFKTLFCKLHNCPIEEYESTLLWKTMFRHALIPAFFLNLLDKEYFHIDISEIRLLGTIRSPEHFNRELDLFHGRNVRDKKLLRRLLKIRISGRRLLLERNKVHDWVVTTRAGLRSLAIAVLQFAWLLG